MTARFNRTPLIVALRTVYDQIDANYAFDLAGFERQPVHLGLRQASAESSEPLRFAYA